MPAEIRDRYEFAPIGLLRTGLRWRYEAQRQAGFSEAKARIELYPGRGFEQALEDLAGFERVWVVFIFHLNPTWKPKVTPPLRNRLVTWAAASRPSRIVLPVASLHCLVTSGLRGSPAVAKLTIDERS